MKPIECRMLMLFTALLMPPAIGFSASPTPLQDSRYNIMDKELTCIENQRQHNITWADVCDIPQNNSQSPSDSPAPKDAVLQNWNSYMSSQNPPNTQPSPKDSALNWPPGMAANRLATDPDLFKQYQFQLLSEFSYIEYKEPSVGMREKGPYFGIEGIYNWRPPAAQGWPVDVFHLDAHLNYGLVDYKSPDGEINDLNDYMLEPRAWLGRDFSPFDFTRLTPYAGLGYRFLFDGLGKVSDIGGYDRTSEYFYAPVGFEIENVSAPGWQFGMNAEYDIFIQGWQESYLSDITGAYPNLNNKQTGGFGLRGSFDIIKKMDRINIIFSPYVRYWNINQSKTSTAVNNSSGISFVGYEPKNNSTEVGAKIGVQF